MHYCMYCLVLINFYIYNNNIYVFEILCRMLNIAFDSLINIKANFVFIILQREVYACRAIYLETFIIAL